MYTVIYVSDNHKHFTQMIKEYEKRLQKKLQLICIKPDKWSDNKAIKTKETIKIIEKIQSASTYNILLDETGKEFRSLDFESYIHSKLHEYPRVCCIIGWAYWVDKELIKEHIHAKICLGKMTLPHGLALGVILEQIYRATMIQKGRKYHHE